MILFNMHFTTLLNRVKTILVKHYISFPLRPTNSIDKIN